MNDKVVFTCDLRMMCSFDGVLRLLAQMDFVINDGLDVSLLALNEIYYVGRLRLCDWNLAL
jgi:hypothetical protein